VNVSKPQPFRKVFLIYGTVALFPRQFYDC
jgi:hypothetical protein